MTGQYKDALAKGGPVFSVVTPISAPILAKVSPPPTVIDQPAPAPNQKNVVSTDSQIIASQPAVAGCPNI
jgi:hypothetical protein